MPVLQWLPGYRKTLFRPDLLAGITLATFILPESMAYATLAVRKQAMARVGQTRSGLVEDALVVAAATAIVALTMRATRG